MISLTTLRFLPAQCSQRTKRERANGGACDCADTVRLVQRGVTVIMITNAQHALQSTPRARLHFRVIGPLLSMLKNRILQMAPLLLLIQSLSRATLVRNVRLMTDRKK